MAFRFFALGFVMLLGTVSTVEAASLSVTPAAGTFVVGSTFEVPIYLDTEGESINAVAVFVEFPPDKLQLVSPAIGRSVIGIWPDAPRFNNLNGTVELKGLIPGGINTSNGLVTTLTFRVKAVGQGTVKLLDDSQALLNDGVGTEALDRLNHGIYKLVLPPPAGPVVTSETHPDSAKWYSNNNLFLNWVADGVVEGYSYLLTREPATLPDDIAEGPRTSVVYQSLADGLHYFHIKSLRSGGWGGVTHFAAAVDTTPPAEFTLDFVPGARTTRRQPVIQWVTTDSLSGLDHYELKIIPLSRPAAEPSVNGSQPLFIEAASPYVAPPLERGRYDVIVRAYDRAGNYREAVSRLAVVNALFKPIGEEGLEIVGAFTVPWLAIWFIAVLLFASLAYLAWRIKHWHRRLDEQRAKKILPAPVKQQLEELQRYRAKYGQILILILSLLTTALGRPIEAVEPAVAPPVIETVSRTITNEDIFYLGGRTDTAQAAVVIYLQNLGTGETASYEIISDEQGEWFYRHDTFLSSGDYQIWAQSRAAEVWSPPSPQVTVNVRPTALQFGASRLSYSLIFLVIIVILAVATLGLIIYNVVHIHRGRQKHALLIKEIREAEESVRRGFAVLRRDIAAELTVIKKARLARELAAEEKQVEEHLLKDLAAVERYIGREIWEVEQAEG